jgi:hypothetical protein
MEPIQVRLPPADRDALRVEAAAKGITIAEVAREAIREHLSRQTLARALPLLDQALVLPVVLAISDTRTTR